MGNAFSTWRVAATLLACVASSCGGATSSASNTAVAGGAVANATMAAAMWAVGGGCKLQGCPYGSYCNKNTGFCDTRRCSDGCPEGTVCNEGLNRCQGPQPASPPNDFLPSDQPQYNQ